MSFQEFVDYDETWKKMNGVKTSDDEMSDDELKKMGVIGF